MTIPNLISVIIVTHQAGEHLYQVIASVLEQESRLELILVNNGNPFDIESKLIEKFKDTPQVRLMTGHGDIGLVKGRNLGARVASGDHLLFLDDHCVLPQGALRLLADEASKRDGPFFAGARLVNEEDVEQLGSRLSLLTPLIALTNLLRLGLFFPAQRLGRHRDEEPLDTEAVPAVSGAVLFCSKGLFEYFNGFDEHYFPALAAMDLCVRYAQEGGDVLFLPSLTVTLLPKKRPRFNAEVEKRHFLAYERYFFYNFGATHTQPALWTLSILYEGMFLLRFIFRRSTVVF